MMQENGRLFSGNQIDTANSMIEYGPLEWLDGKWNDLPNSPFTADNGFYGSTYWKDRYYFGGIFLALGSRKAISFDGDSMWYALDGGLTGSQVNVLEGHGDSLYAGGFFHERSDHIAIWDGEDRHSFFPEVEYVGQVTGLKSYNGSL